MTKGESVAAKSKTQGSLAAQLRALDTPAVEPKKAPAKKKATTEPGERQPSTAPTRRKPAPRPMRQPENANATAKDRYPVQITPHISTEMERMLVEIKLKHRLSAASVVRGALELMKEGWPDPSDPDAPEQPSRYVAAVLQRARKHHR